MNTGTVTTVTAVETEVLQDALKLGSDLVVATQLVLRDIVVCGKVSQESFRGLAQAQNAWIKEFGRCT